MKNNSQKEEQANSYLPLGSCRLKDYQKIEAIKVALNSSYNQYIVFSSDIRNLSWIVVKQIVQNNEPIFHLYCQTFKKRFLSAQKQSNNIGCNFLISKSEKPGKDSQYVGKLRGNFRNNDFIIYDGGQNPKKKTGRKRKQFAAIKFHEQSIFGQDKQEKFEIIVPQVRQVNQKFDICPKYLPKEFVPNGDKQNLLYEQSLKKSSDVINIVQLNLRKEKSGRQNGIVNILMSNLIDKHININLKVQQNNQNQSIFDFKTRGKNTYSLRFSHPFNILQAFGIALTFIQTNTK